MRISEVKKRRNRLPQKGCVYYLIFPNNKGYIGITQYTCPMGRIRSHKKGRKLVGRAINKYGLENVRIKILGYSTGWKKLKELEIEYIAKYKTKKPFGYNITEGGEGSRGFRQSKKVRKAHTERLRGNKRLLGHVHSSKSRNKMKLAWSQNDKGKKAITKGLKKKWRDPKWKRKMLKILNQNNNRRWGIVRS